jgi:LmbE family N-acetylglucosaminyl deacetylase
MLFELDQPHVLAIGAHPDDIEIGAGGLIHRLIRERNAVVHFLILTEGIQHRDPDQSYEPSMRREESIKAGISLGLPAENIEVLKFPDCGLHAFNHDLIREIEGRVNLAARRVRPYDLILTHHGQDTHPDHREAHEATISALRYCSGLVLLYQAPSTKPNGFHPNFFVNLEPDAILQKDRALQAHHSQHGKDFMRVARTVGMAAGWATFHRSSAEYVEAFEIYKAFWM